MKVGRTIVLWEAGRDMMTPEARQQILDEEHLRLLSIGYYIHGGTYALFGLFPLIYVVIGLFIVFGEFPMPEPMPPPAAQIPDPSVFGWLFVIIGFATTFVFELFGTSQLYVGRCIQRRRSYVLCQIVAGISCLMIPFGTLLGVVTFMVLQRPNVAIMFGQVPSGRSVPPAPVP